MPTQMYARGLRQKHLCLEVRSSTRLLPSWFFFRAWKFTSMLPKASSRSIYWNTHSSCVDHTYSTNDATTHSFAQLIVQDKVYTFCSSIARAYTKLAFLCMVQVSDHYYCLSIMSDLWMCLMIWSISLMLSNKNVESSFTLVGGPCATSLK